MGVMNSNSFDCQTERRKNKTLKQQLKVSVKEGIGISDWEASALLDVIDDIYFNDQDKLTKHGQVQFSCVSSKEGAGKPLKECDMVNVHLTLFDEHDQEDLAMHGKKHRQKNIRMRRILRICDEARDQGGLLTQEDLAQLLMCDSKTIGRHAADAVKDGFILPTRGNIKDIGPGITHRELIIRHWMDGKEELEICTATKHSMKAVENYLKHFKRVIYLREGKKFTEHEISVTAGVSQRAVLVYLDIYNSLRGTGIHQHRMDEIFNIGDQYYKEVGEKKDLSPAKPSKTEWRQQ